MFLIEVLTVLILLLLIPMIQELIHWLIIVGIHVIISKSDFGDDVSMALP